MINYSQVKVDCTCNQFNIKFGINFNKLHTTKSRRKIPWGCLDYLLRETFMQRIGGQSPVVITINFLIEFCWIVFMELPRKRWWFILMPKNPNFTRIWCLLHAQFVFGIDKKVDTWWIAASRYKIKIHRQDNCWPWMSLYQHNRYM